MASSFQVFVPNLCMYLFPMHVFYTCHFIVLDLITLTAFSEEYKLRIYLVSSSAMFRLRPQHLLLKRPESL